MTIDQLLDYMYENHRIRRQKDIAKFFDVSTQAISNWKRSGKVPAKYALKVQVSEPTDYKELVETINDKDKYFLGICVGMQILSDFGFEIEKTKGLGLISGEVKKINTNLKLPHVGWNSVFFKKEDLLLKDISSKTEFYFTHSYEFLTKSSDNVLAESLYDKQITSIVKKNNIYGVQFHPEKSQEAGLKLLKNYSVL